VGQPSIGAPLTIGPTPAPTLGAPAAAPNSSDETPHTYAPNSGTPPIAPGASTNHSSSSDTRSFRLPVSTDAGNKVEPPQIEVDAPSVDGPQLSPPPVPRPDGADPLTSHPVSPRYFQLLPSPPRTVPAQTVSARRPAADLPADDAGWGPVK
jgi:hypothetical protein